MANDGTVKIGAEIDEKEFKSGLSKLGKTAAVALGAATAAAGVFAKSAIDAGMTFDKSMSQVAATMGKTVGEIQDLRDAALEAGSTTAFSATEAADALNYLALAGYDSATAADTLPAVLNLAAAGSMDLAYASDLATDAMSALSIEAGNENLTKFGDQMAVTASKANTGVSQLGEAILTVGATAKNLAGGTTELNTALGILADNGTKGAEGGTRLRNIILSLTAPTDTAAEQLERLGVSVFDAFGNMRPLEDILSDLNSSMSSFTAEDRINAINKIFNKTDIGDVNYLLSVSRDRWNELSTAIDESQGAMQRMADTQLNNLSGDITIFKSALEGAQIALSDQMEPALRDLVQFGTTSLGTLTDAIQTGSTDAIFNAALSMVDSLSASLEENLPTLIENGLTFLENFASSFRENAGLLVDAGIQLVLSLAQGLADSFPTIIEKLPGIVSDIAGVINDNAPKLLMAGMNLIITLGLGLIKAIPALIKNIPQIILAIVDVITAFNWMNLGKGIIDGLINGIKGMFGSIKVTAQTVVQNLRTVFSDLPGYLKAIGKDMIKGLWEGIKSMVSWIKDNIVGFIKGIAGSLSGIMRKEAESAAKSTSSRSSKARSAPESSNNPRPSPASMSPAGDFSGKTAGNEGGSYSLTASDFSRAAAVRALESAIPNAVSRVSVSTAAMAPAAGDGGNRPRSLAAEVAEAVHNELNGMEVTMDGRTVGRMVTKQQNNIGRAFGTA